MQKSRTNPAVGVREDFINHLKLYVAGGMSEAANGGAASYEPTLEVFNSKSNKWTVMGSMPLTVWTPNESVYANGVLYWMTSARAYSIMGYEMDKDKWKELDVPMGDTLEFATLVPCDGKVAVVGGTHDGNVLVWELGDGDEWILIERMPLKLAKRFAGSSTKCAGIEGGVCLYKDIASAMLNNDNAIRNILRNERNKRPFDKESRNVETITRLIIKYVKLKLISLKVKQSVQVRKVIRELEIFCGWYLQMTTLILVYNQNAAATRNAKLIGALQKFVGPDVKAFLSHVKPALLSAVEAL
ncbi:unusual floral organs-like protein [Tanacetum coccineum]